MTKNNNIADDTDKAKSMTVSATTQDQADLTAEAKVLGLSRSQLLMGIWHAYKASKHYRSGPTSLANAITIKTKPSTEKK